MIYALFSSYKIRLKTFISMSAMFSISESFSSDLARVWGNVRCDEQYWQLYVVNFGLSVNYIIYIYIFFCFPKAFMLSTLYLDWRNNLDYVKCLLFCSNTFGVWLFIDVLEPENKPGCCKIQTGSGVLGLTGTSDTKSMKNYLNIY